MTYKNLKQKYFSLAVLVIVALTAACSKKAEKSTAKLSLNLNAWPATQAPAQKGLGKKSAGYTKFAPSLSTLTRLMVNVGGPFGVLPPIIWERSHGLSGASETPVMNYSVDVPKGGSGYVQVLAVFEESSSGSMLFYYGDSAIDLNQSVVPAGVVARAVGSNSGQGSIAGRYLTGSSSGPTGNLYMRIKIPPSYVTVPGIAPSMIVSKSEMFNGWFSVFALQGVPFEYDINGEKLFDGAFDARDSGHLYSSRNLRMWIPPYYYCNGASGCSNRQAQGSMRTHLGFFGPGAAGKTLYYNQSSGAMAGRFTELASTSTTTVTWTPSFSAAATTETPSLSYAFVEAANGGAKGGTAGTSSSCSSANNFSSCMYVDPTNANGVHGSEILNFKGPFRKINSYSFMSFSCASGSCTSKFSLLPGTKQTIDRMRVFVRAGKQATWDSYEDVRTPDGFSCSEAENIGFRHLHDFSVTDASDSTTYTIGNIADSSVTASNGNTQLVSAWNAAQNLQVLLCPTKAGVGGTSYYDSALAYEYSGGSGQVYQLAVAPQGHQSVASATGVDTCLEYKVNLTDGSSNLIANPNAGTSISLSLGIVGTGGLNSAVPTLFSDSTCTNSFSPVTIPGGGTTSSSFWVKSLTAYYGTYKLSAHSTNNSSVSDGSIVAVIYDSGVVTPSQLTIDLSSSIALNECVAGSVSLSNSSKPAINTSGTAISITLAPQGSFTSVQFFSDSSCASALASNIISIPSAANLGSATLANHLAKFYMKYTSTISSCYTGCGITAAANSLTSGSKDNFSSVVERPSTIALVGSSGTSVSNVAHDSACTLVKAQFLLNGSAFTAPASTSLSLTYSGSPCTTPASTDKLAVFGTASDCTNNIPIGSSVAVPISSTEVQFYVKGQCTSNGSFGSLMFTWPSTGPSAVIGSD